MPELHCDDDATTGAAEVADRVRVFIHFCGVLQTLMVRRSQRVRAKRGPMINSAPSRTMRPQTQRPHPSRRPSSLFELRRAPQDEERGCAKSPRGTRCPGFCCYLRALRTKRAQGKPDASWHPQPRTQKVVWSYELSFTAGFNRHPVFPGNDGFFDVTRFVTAHRSPARIRQRSRRAPLESRNASFITLEANRTQAKICGKCNFLQQAEDYHRSSIPPATKNSVPCDRSLARRVSRRRGPSSSAARREVREKTK
jgi:hypothetical protein